MDADLHQHDTVVETGVGETQQYQFVFTTPTPPPCRAEPGSEPITLHRIPARGGYRIQSHQIMSTFKAPPLIAKHAAYIIPGNTA